MNQPNSFRVEQSFGVSGRVTPIVVDAKTGKEVRRYPTQKNIILDSGISSIIQSTTWGTLLNAATAGTGTTPTKDLTASSYSQTGTTVTRQGGSFSFTSGMVGRRIVFSDGQQAKITAYTNATTVTVDVSQTVPKAERPKTITSISSTATEFTVTATGHGLRVGDKITISGASVSGYNATWTVTAIGNANAFDIASASNYGAATGGTFVKAACLAVLFRTDRTGLATQVKTTTTKPVFTDPVDGRPSQCTIFNSSTETLTLRRTYDFTEETGNVNYTEISITFDPGISTRFAVILLAGAVTVESGQLLRVIYDLEITPPGKNGPQVITDPIPGWPRPYNVSSITSTGSAFTVTLSETHHYKAGGKITLAGIVYPRTAITAATSTGSNFTITAPGHSFSSSDVITIQGMTPSGYNGTFTVASVAGDDITVTSTLNPGTGTVFGTVRKANPQATAIVGITSDWDFFTINAPGHGLSASDVITVKGVTPNGYNGAWTVDSISGDDIIIADTRNLGAGSGGTVNERNAVWYDDEWTIASVGSTTVVVNSTLNLGTVQTSEGTATNNVRRKLGYCLFGIAGIVPSGDIGYNGDDNIYYDNTILSTPQRRALIGSSQYILPRGGSGEFKSAESGDVWFIVGNSSIARPTRWPVSKVTSESVADYIKNDSITFPQETSLTVTSGANENVATATTVTANTTNGYQDHVITWGVTKGNASNIRGINFTCRASYDDFYIDFEEPQRKDPTHKFTLTVRKRPFQNLTVDTET